MTALSNRTATALSITGSARIIPPRLDQPGQLEPCQPIKGHLRAKIVEHEEMARSKAILAGLE
jgi:hypothetical protein